MTQTQRHFPNFLEAYLEYANDDFCPIEFHRWTGISIVAAALERKVSLPRGKIFFYPNLYVMLVSHPAVGKSTAIDVGVDLIEEMRKAHNVNFRIIPNQATEPALTDLMKIVDRFPFRVGDREQLMPHSSGYFYASEASSSALQNTHGDFIATMTAFYDCPRWFRKKTKGEHHLVEIENACMNMLAGATFDYLKNLVNESSVMGGFASRLIYVISRERKVQETKWDDSKQTDQRMRGLLMEDLAHINKLAGVMRPTQAFTELWEKWQPDFTRYLIKLNSPRIESIMSRKGTNLMKLAIVLSICESDSLVVDARHFEQAREMIDEVTKDNAFVISSAVMADRNSQGGLTQAICTTFRRKGDRVMYSTLKSRLLAGGFDILRVGPTIEAMIQANQMTSLTIDGVPHVELLVDPYANL